MRFGLALMIAVLGSCTTTTPPPGDLTASARERAFTPAPTGGTLTNAVWLETTREIVAVYTPAGAVPAERHLYAVGLDGGNLRRLPLPDDPRSCRATAHVSPRPLSDGRLAYIQHCYGDGPNVPREANALMAYDPRTGQSTQLFPYFLHANQAQYAVAPDLRRGIIGNGRSLLEQLVWLLPERTEELALPVGRALSPDWSPDGGTIAFVGTPEGGPAAGPGRLDLPQHLYLMDAAGRDLRRPLGTDVSIGGPHWSPDSRFVVASMTVQGRSGIWLAELATRKLWLVLEERDQQTGGAFFLPDGRTLIVPLGVASVLPLIPPLTAPAPRVGLLVLTLPPPSELR